MGLDWGDLVAGRALPFRAAALIALALLATSATASAQSAPAPAASAPAPQSAGQGIAVLGMGSARNEAYALARAVYGSSLRPRGLDEIRARVLAGDPAPALASRETRELAELRAGVTGDDAASRRVLAGIAQQLGVQAILVVRVDRAAVAPEAGPADAGEGDAGEDATAPEAPPPAPTTSARLFLADTGDLDAARYAPDTGLEGADAWRSTVSSLERRFVRAPAVAPAPGGDRAHVAAPTMRSNEAPEGKPFYASAWFWGAVGAAVLVGGAFFLVSRDTSDDPIHLQMRVPR